MRIFAVGRNYAKHIKELANPLPDEPVIFSKPDTALIQNNKPFYLPSFSNNIHHEVELVLRICKNGKHIEEKFSHKYYDEIGIGIDFTARDYQEKLRKAGSPWELCKGFDGSAPISENFIPVSDFKDLNNISFKLEVNRQTKQQGNSADMLFSFDNIVSFLSRFFTLKTGDLIFTGTPEGVGPVKIGDHLTAYIENEKLLEFEVK